MWAYMISAPYTSSKLDVPAPRAHDLQDGQVLLRVLAGGVCGSDLPAFLGAHLPGTSPTRAAVPGFTLHEVVGEIVASRDPELVCGSTVVGWASGRDALAEYIIADGEGLFTYDEALAADVAIILQAIACVCAAVDQIGDVRGQRAAVLGLGPIGMLFAHVLKSRGASFVTGVDRVDRSDVGSAFGIDDVVVTSSDVWAAGLSGSRRPDLVVEAVGHQMSTLMHAVEAVADCGTVFYFGIPDDAVYPFPMSSFLRKNLTLKSGSTRDKRAALVSAHRYLDEHAELAATYPTHRFAFADVQLAFGAAIRPAVGQLKIVLSDT